MSTTDEIWMPVKGHENYEVSNEGRVRSLFRGPRIRRPSGLGAGYLGVRLRRNPVVFRSVHRLVAEAFLGDCPDGCEINHIDGCKTNNAVTNLEYVSSSQNKHHAVAIGAIRCCGDAPQAKASDAQMIAGYELVAAGATLVEAASLVGVTAGSLKRMCHGKTWRQLGLKPIVRGSGFRKSTLVPKPF